MRFAICSKREKYPDAGERLGVFSAESGGLMPIRSYIYFAGKTTWSDDAPAYLDRTGSGWLGHITFPVPCSAFARTHRSWLTGPRPKVMETRVRSRATLVCSCCLLGAALLGMACRALDPRYACVTRPGSTTRLVTDSAEVRHLLDDGAKSPETATRLMQERTREEGAALVAEMLEHPERYMRERKALLGAMDRQAGVIVTGQQYFRVLEQSEARCANDPLGTAEFIRVRVTTGPVKRAEGWACMRDLQPTGDWWF